MQSPLYLAISLVLAAAGAAMAQDDSSALEEQAVQAAVEKVAPSVVKIETLGGLERVGTVLVATGPTTGLIVAEDGYILSSAFNFVQKPSSILVTLPSGKRAPAEIVARDHSRMLVLLKVETQEKLPVPESVPRSEMIVGQWAIAVGRTYDQPEPNLSVGILSATNRIWGKAIQTDAKVSPANYGGPLVDIRGRVLGVLVPLSPQPHGTQGETSEVAGAEWYDSGIGFAVPLHEVLPRLPEMREGKDQHPGLLGVSLKAGDIYSLPAEIAASQAGSPAYKAGLRAGDTIVEIAGAKIDRQSQLRHALSPRYAGESVSLAALRSKEGQAEKERIEVTVELAEKLVPYEHPFLGILPLRDVPAGEVRVRYVYPDSPAAKAGIQPGDIVKELAGADISTAAQLRDLVANLEREAKVAIEIERAGEVKTLELEPGSIPSTVPGELPPASGDPPAPPEDKSAVGLVEIKIAEEKNECVAYVPENYHPAVPHGVIVVLPAPGPIERDQLAEQWKEVCEARQLIVLAPMSASKEKWEPTETAFVRKTLDDLTAHYSVDPTRIVAYGRQAGGSMAFLVGFEHRDRIRAIAVVDALPPARSKLPENDPIQRLAFYLASASKVSGGPGYKALVTRLEQAKFPVVQKSLGDESRVLSAAELDELARWIDTLDRI